MFNLIRNQGNAALNHNEIPSYSLTKMFKCQVLIKMFSSGNVDTAESTNWKRCGIV